MDFLVYAFLYFGLACIYILIRSIYDDQFSFFTVQIKEIPILLILFLKILPLLCSLLWFFGLEPIYQNSNFFLCLAFLCCIVGDIAIQYSLIYGFGAFAAAHLCFSAFFVMRTIFYITDYSILLWVFCGIIIMFFIMKKFILFLKNSEKGLGKFYLPLVLYSCLLTVVLLTSLVFWLIYFSFEAIIIPIGASCFMVSDMLIAIREFHHKTSYSVLKIMSTYYLALFLLSLAVLIR